MNDVNAVVFDEGVHEYTGKNGTAIFVVPHDVTLGDLMPALTNLVIESDRREKESAA